MVLGVHHADMWIGTGVFLVAVGAILKFAVTDEVSGVDLGTVGVILMLAGAALTVLSLLYDLANRDRRRTAVVRDRVVERDPLP
jgi:hypothetical protein